MTPWEKEGLVDAAVLRWEQGRWGKAGHSCRLVHACSLQESLRCSRAVQLRLILLAARCGSGQGLIRGSVPVLGFRRWLSWPWQNAGEWLVPGQTSSS